MEIVIDSNVLFRMLISSGSILNLVFDERIKVLAPQRLREEFINNKEEVLHKSKLSKNHFNELCRLLFNQIDWIVIDEYKPFLQRAKQLLDPHFKDTDFIALCMSRGTKLWTYEKRLIQLGFGVSTKEIARMLS